MSPFVRPYAHGFLYTVSKVSLGVPYKFYLSCLPFDENAALVNELNIRSKPSPHNMCPKLRQEWGVFGGPILSI